MKRFVRVLTAAICAGAVMVAYAGPQECKEPPGQMKEKGKPSKVTILHCGCPDAGSEMYYVEIQVSSKSKGHKRHTSGSISSCSDGSDSYMDFVRAGDDCQLGGDDYLPECSTGQEVGAVCGMMDPAEPS